MRRRPSKLVTATRDRESRDARRQRMRGQGVRNPSSGRRAAADRRRAAGQHGAAARSPTRRARRRLHRTHRPHPAGHRRGRQGRCRHLLIVLDRNTGQIVSNGNGEAFAHRVGGRSCSSPTTCCCRSPRARRSSPPLTASALDVMLRSSDDSAAEIFWNRSGGSAIISRVAARYGLAFDVDAVQRSMVHHHEHRRRPGPVLRQAARTAPAGCRRSRPTSSCPTWRASRRPTGIDGYPQRFGIPDGLYAEPVAVKQGWFCCWNGGNQLHLSTGVIGPDASLRHGDRLDASHGDAAAREHHHSGGQDHVPRRPHLARLPNVA